MKKLELSMLIEVGSMQREEDLLLTMQAASRRLSTE
jgi:hypothetical protein